MNSYQFYTPRLTFISKIIIIATVAIFLLSSVLELSMGGGLKPFLGLTATGFVSGGIHTILTYPFMGTGLFEVIFDCLLVWFIGCELEALWGRGKYLLLALFATLLSAAIYLAVSLVFPSVGGVALTGLAGFCNALLVAYAVLYPDRYFSFFMIFPIQAKWFCLILLGMQLYLGIFSPAGVLAWGHMGGMLAGFLFMKWPKFGTFKGISSSKPKRKGNLKLVKGDDDTPKYWQ